MATFFKVASGTPDRYFINLDMIEQVNPSENKVYMVGGLDECYTLNDEDFDVVIDYVYQNLYEPEPNT